MNYLRGALSAASQYYKELPPINPSTLTGAIDVIVVQRPAEEQGNEGQMELACTPFHVRFGKWQVLRPGDKKVKVLVNGEAIPFNMKIGDAGEAFFVIETEGDVPDDLVTSPVLSATQSTMNSPVMEPQTPPPEELDARMASMSVNDASPQRKGRKSTELAEPDFLDLDANITPVKNGVPFPTQQELKTPRPADATLPNPERFGADDNKSSVISPSTILGRTANLGKAVVNAAVESEEERRHQLQDKMEGAKNIATKGYAFARTNTKTAEGDKGDEALPELKEGEGSPPPLVFNEDMVLDMSGYHSRDSNENLKRADRPASGIQSSEEPSLQSSRRSSYKESSTPSRSPSPELSSPAGSTPQLTVTSPHPYQNFRALSEPPDVPSSPSMSARRQENAPSEYSWEWGAFPQRSPVKLAFNSSAALLRVRNDSQESTPGLGMARSVSVPVETENEAPEAGSSKFSPKVQVIEEPLSPGAVLSSRRGDETKLILTIGGITYEFELSLCEELSKGDRKGVDEMHTEMAFKAHQVSFKQFMSNDAIVNDDRLVIRWNDRYLTQKDGSAIMASLPNWRESTLKRTKRVSGVVSDDEQASSSDDLTKRKKVANAKRVRATSSWVNWWRSSGSNVSTPADEEAPIITTDDDDSPPSSPKSATELTLEERPSMTRQQSQVVASNSDETISGKVTRFAKTLRLTSDQLKSLKLKPGSNTITFSLSASGAVACTARIFLWESTDLIVISDIDGTITKSDALGHVFTMIGRDWTHIGVAKLYTDICRNGYKIMYLTSRAIGQADSTRDYLKGINQNSYQLPEGPVIMSPDRLMASLHREVIMRKPEVFKMACLRDIQRLFGKTAKNPFYAGFGNRITDALSYRSVNVPSARIFTIDSSGEVKMELLEVAGYKSSYIHMTDLVDQMFPPVTRNLAPEFTDFSYWKQPIQDFPLPDLTPPSPALSARSDTSNQSTFSRIRYFSLGRKAGSNFSLPPPATQKGQTNPTRNDNESRLRQMSSMERLTRSFLPTPEAEEEVSSQTETLIDSENEDKRRKRLSVDSMPGSLPGSVDDRHGFLSFNYEEDSEDEQDGSEGGYEGDDGLQDDEAVEQTFDDDLAAMGVMEATPYL